MNQDSEALHAKPDIAQLLIVSGTRPEIIKLAPVYHALQQTHWARPIWLHTGQHGDMAAQMLDCFHIQPDHVLQRQGSSLLEFATGCRTQLESVLTDTSCEAVIVQGDTESAFQGALAGFYLKVPVVHVEAGLRTYNLHRPFPEEGLRQMIGRIASLHLAPTPRPSRRWSAKTWPRKRSSSPATPSSMPSSGPASITTSTAACRAEAIFW
jgi:UDP-N-acetylglucosamine 2-epimerase (non-hydrolysing)